MSSTHTLASCGSVSLSWTILSPQPSVQEAGVGGGFPWCHEGKAAAWGPHLPLWKVETRRVGPRLPCEVTGREKTGLPWSAVAERFILAS